MDTPATDQPTTITGAQLRAHYAAEAKAAGLELDDADLALIDRLVAATDAARQVEDEMTRSGAVLLSDAGTPRRNPLVSDLRGLVETCAKLTTALDRRLADAAADGPTDRGGTRPFATRGPYAAATGTDDAPAATRRPSRTPRKRSR